MVFLLALLELFFISTTWSDNSLFWKSNPELMRKMIDDRYIVVSVTHSKPKEKGQKYSFSFKSAGIMNISKKFGEKSIQEYHKLPEIINYIKETKFDKGKSELYFYGEAYKYIVKMWLELKPKQVGDDFEIDWQVVRGHLTGMNGKIRLEDHERRTEISLTGTYEATSLPLPAILLDFGLEIVFQQVAKKIRNYLETGYKKETASDH